MGYYCTVPQCSSLSGKSKKVHFHGFPRDPGMAKLWNKVLKRQKPHTKYSKVCSLHFNDSDYTTGKCEGHNVRILHKHAVPSKKLPLLNPDGSAMTLKQYRDIMKCDNLKNNRKSDDDKIKTDVTENIDKKVQEIIANGSVSFNSQMDYLNNQSYNEKIDNPTTMEMNNVNVAEVKNEDSELVNEETELPEGTNYVETYDVAVQTDFSSFDDQVENVDEPSQCYVVTPQYTYDPNIVNYVPMLKIDPVTFPEDSMMQYYQGNTIPVNNVPEYVDNFNAMQPIYTNQIYQFEYPYI